MNAITPPPNGSEPGGMKPLGRDAAPETSELLRPSNSWLQATIWTLLGTAGFAIAWLAVAKTDEVVVAPGKLEPLGSVKDVQMPMGGVVKTILVKEGQLVKANQVLLKLDTEADLKYNKMVRISGILVYCLCKLTLSFRVAKKQKQPLTRKKRNSKPFY